MINKVILLGRLGKDPVIRKLDNGRIVEQGTHDALMELDGAYASQVRAGGSFGAATPTL